tara:strand:+ start:359 stop:694 length:336 start_codon:yes stop_codon:yes gene_type:complete
MKKNKRKRKLGKKNKSAGGGAILFTVGLACLIGLVGIVHIAISNFIRIYEEDEKRYVEEIAIFEEERENLKDKNSILLSSENIYRLLRRHKYFSNDSLSFSSPKDTIKVRF